LDKLKALTANWADVGRWDMSVFNHFDKNHDDNTPSQTHTCRLSRCLKYCTLCCVMR